MLSVEIIEWSLIINHVLRFYNQIKSNQIISYRTIKLNRIELYRIDSISTVRFLVYSMILPMQYNSTDIGEYGSVCTVQFNLWSTIPSVQYNSTCIVWFHLILLLDPISSILNCLVLRKVTTPALLQRVSTYLNDSGFTSMYVEG